MEHEDTYIPYKESYSLETHTSSNENQAYDYCRVEDEANKHNQKP
jgi:hypothetical protein